MVVLLHGAVGGWDEVAVAVAALVVLWVTIKLAGRKPASDDDDEDEDALPVEPAAEEHTGHARTSSNVG